jgi:hypothetical protein
VNLSIPLPDGLSLRIADDAAGEGSYPTRRLHKGLLLAADGRSLAEEGVGFGVPILKRGVQTIFPGEMRLVQRRRGRLWEVTAMYDLCLVERLVGSGGSSVRPRLLYAAKDSLAALHRRSPRLRRLLTATSSTLRRTLGWETTYEEAGIHAPIEVRYTIDGDAGRVDVSLVLAGLPDGVTEVIVMNEQGGRSFDLAVDSNGAAQHGPEIGTWDAVTAARAAFVSTTRHAMFSLGQAEGARLRRGRELVGARLAWAGFGYSLPPTLTRFAYDVRIERTS